MPVSYANAFVKPVQPRSGEDLVTLSIEALKAHVELLTKKFSLRRVGRFWFSTRDIQIEGTRACEAIDELLAQLKSVLRSGMSVG